MFIESNQGTKHPEVGPWHYFTLLSLVTLDIFLKGWSVLAEDRCSLKYSMAFLDFYTLIQSKLYGSLQYQVASDKKKLVH